MRLYTAFSRTAAVALAAAVLAPVALGVPADTAANARLLPPGCRWDTVFTPRAPRTATYEVKLHAVLTVAEAQLGKPYIWGTNPDQGSRGFDCSNFTSYVYRHALGVRFTTSSRGQAAYVGWPVAKFQKRPGDLLILLGGAHVGIYVGNDRMIQCGGGLRPSRVGYLPVGPSSYWGRRITAVKRIFVGAHGAAVSTHPAVTEVTVTALNVRGGPGLDSPIVGLVHRGDRYVQSTMQGNWRNIWFSGAKVWFYGGTFSRIVAGAPAVRITSSVLNVRTGPGLGYRDVGDVLRDQYYARTGASNGWYRICHAGEPRWVSGAGCLPVTP